jgi:hypothetical protein
MVPVKLKRTEPPPRDSMSLERKEEMFVQRQYSSDGRISILESGDFNPPPANIFKKRESNASSSDSKRQSIFGKKRQSLSKDRRNSNVVNMIQLKQ